MCDIQEKFRPRIKAMPAVIQVAKTMSRASKELNIPLIVTEQYPKGLGKTVPEIDISHAKVYEKLSFSMLTPEVLTELAEVKSVVLYGIEAHVCILNTTLDLLWKGYDVHLVVDGTSSMRQYDRLTALSRLRSNGAFLTTCESVIFQLACGSNHPNFKNISQLMKDHVAVGVNPEIPEASL
eukprot:TRINITY_DN3455_c0_g1_i4.p2 TRINITY_DN3455_c0_g1~~TRINITY_DN3455_c0_g1_i4.p2  ORF type:complete len:181 (-),score=38.62 TRINITY_DN3455_c0_g1_i4:63-605(-)